MIYAIRLFATRINKSKDPEAPNDIDKEKAKEEQFKLIMDKLSSSKIVHRGCIVIQVDRSDSNDGEAPKVVERKYFVVKLYDKNDINLNPDQSSSLSLFISGTSGAKSLQYSDKQMVIARVSTQQKIFDELTEKKAIDQFSMSLFAVELDTCEDDD